MKKIALFVTALAVSLSLGGKALADTTAESFAEKAGITPDNTILYPVDKALDDLKVSIATDEQKEAGALVEVAEERLGESEVMVNEDKADLSTEALNEYNEKMTEAQDKIDSAIKVEDLEELEKLQDTITDKQMKSIEVLKGVESKVSGNAKETLALVIEMQTRKKEAIVAVAKERQALIQNKKAVKEAEKTLVQAKKAGDEQAVKTAEEALKQAQQTLSTQREKLAQAVAAKKKATKGGVGQLKKQAKEKQKEQNEDTAKTTPAEDNETTSPVVTDTNTPDATSIEEAVKSNTSTTTSTKTDVTVKENKGQAMKTVRENNVKENQGQDVKADKKGNEKANKGQDKKAARENNSGKENNSNN